VSDRRPPFREHDYTVPAPVFVLLALALGMSAIAALLLSRSTPDQSLDAPDVRAAPAASETVLLMALIWVSFQAYAAFALVGVCPHVN
jgi:hypothetical protein